MFDAFYSYAKANLKHRYPLLIAGGCGLNCDWNSKWRDCDLFPEVFVPPVTNDSGSAIGTAIDAQFVYSGNAKVTWSVYSGPEFVLDGYSSNFKEVELDVHKISAALENGCVVAWVQGRSEIGPRALGNRSILAAPFHMHTKERLNDIKKREWYRPIAPVCLEEDADLLFGLKSNSPFMLYFAQVRADGIDAIKHVDGSARVQTVNKDQNPPLYMLLKAFKQRTGVGALCNTSLNRKGRGFFSRSSDLFEFAGEQHIDLVVINNRTYASVEFSGY
jgi:hydroxymethyl cephem carbamoyltransferase